MLLTVHGCTEAGDDKHGPWAEHAEKATVDTRRTESVHPEVVAHLGHNRIQMFELPNLDPDLGTLSMF